MTGWYCPKCERFVRHPRPAMGVVGYATLGRVRKCWRCGREVIFKNPEPPKEMVTDSNQLIGDSEQLGEPVSNPYMLEE